MKQGLLTVVLVALLALTGYVIYAKMNPVSSENLVVRNVADRTLTVQVGTQKATVLAKNATAEDVFVEGMLVRVWVGEEAAGLPIGWRIYKVMGEVSVGYADDVVTISGEGLEQTLLNNGPGPAVSEPEPAK
jgi:hypothetical protein